MPIQPKHETIQRLNANATRSALRIVQASDLTGDTQQRQTRLPWGSRFWNNPRIRAILWQTIVVAVVGTMFALVAIQTASNLRIRSIASGFHFLGRAAGFEISSGPLPYSSRDSYARALTVGLVNTLRVSLLGILLATALGLVIGVGRLSKIWVISTLASAYVEIVRNTPLLLQLLFWYSLSQALPSPAHALRPVPGIFLCVRGLFIPSLTWKGGFFWFGSAVLVFKILVPFVLTRSQRRREQTGRGLPTTRLLVGLATILLSTAVLLGHPRIAVERPALMGFNFHGGMSISPEFAALLIGLSTYTAAFIGETIRGGVLAIDRGQTEAASALGLSRVKILRLVVLPQALRVILPPTTSQFLNLAKNSSLAVAIGYPDLISITSTTLNQTGQAIEAIALAMFVYLTISLAISLVMNLCESGLVPLQPAPCHP
jgi:general L-amino acid transport system permease protein